MKKAGLNRFSEMTKRLLELEAENELLRSQLPDCYLLASVSPDTPEHAGYLIDKHYRKLVENELHSKGSHPTRCAICSSTEKLVFDHCHTTGLYRGHICNACNLLLGHAKDDQKRLYRAGRYLRLFQVKVHRTYGHW